MGHRRNQHHKKSKGYTPLSACDPQTVRRERETRALFTEVKAGLADFVLGDFRRIPVEITL